MPRHNSRSDGLSPGSENPKAVVPPVVTRRSLRERGASLNAESAPVEALPPAVAADSHAAARASVLAADPLAADDSARMRGRRAGAVSAADAAPRSVAGRRADDARVIVDPPKAARDYSGGAGEAAIPPRRRRASRGDITKKAFGGLAFLFVAGIAVATSVPAEAYFAATPSAIVAPITDPDTTSRPPGQVLAAVAGGASVIARDAYTITEIPKTTTASAVGAAGGAGAAFANAAVGTIQWPLPAGTRISDDFGPRSSPGGIGSTYHEGVDFAPGMGAPIQVVADGVVRLTQLSDAGGYGCYAIVDHNVGGVAFASLYGHMQCDSVAIEEGAHVVAGQLVGLVGSTGASTGAHLHFEIHDEGDTPVDPLPWMDAHVTA